MPAASPHYLLYSEVQPADSDGPRWRFVLQSLGGESRLVAADCEANMPRSRVELLAVVRGLEALGQPSRVTLLTGSRYVGRGLRRGLSQWREHQWRWERFGELVPIRDQDLWRRVDRALRIHHVEWSPVALSNAWADACSSTGIDEMPAAESPSCPVADADRPRIMPAGEEPAMLQLPRETSWRTRPRTRAYRPLSGTIERLGHWFLGWLAAIWRPAFTRTA